MVHKKTAAIVALTEVKPEDKQELAALVTAVKSQFNAKADEIRRTWGGGIMGRKSTLKMAKRAKQAEIAAAVAAQGAEKLRG